MALGRGEKSPNKRVVKKRGDLDSKTLKKRRQARVLIKRIISRSKGGKQGTHAREGGGRDIELKRGGGQIVGCELSEKAGKMKGGGHGKKKSKDKKEDSTELPQPARLS